jgi:hypothetical protein
MIADVMGTLSTMELSSPRANLTSGVLRETFCGTFWVEE